MNRVETHEEYGRLLSEARKRKEEMGVLRMLCRRDLFFLGVRMCGREDLDTDFHFDRTRDIMAAPDGMMDLWAREHGKSSWITFLLSVQDILNNSEERLGIFSHKGPMAKDHLIPIKYEFEENARLKKLFPDILWGNPQKQSPKWSEDEGIIVKRRGNYLECTVEAHGLIDGLPTGVHYTIIIWDDVINEKYVTSPEMIVKTMDAINSSTNLKTRGARLRGVGTYYHYNDPYVQMISRGILKERKFPATEDGTATGTPVLFTLKELGERRKSNTPYQFACQYLLDPKMESKYGLDERWLKYWSTARPECSRGMNVIFLVDPANEKKKSNDYTVITVVGLSADSNKYVIEWVRDRMSLVERTAKLFELHRRYNTNRRVRGVYYEQYGMQSDIAHIESVMELENYRFKITPVKGNIEKNDRINLLVPMFQEGEIVIPEECWYMTIEGQKVDLTQIFINEEYRMWPYGTHDDMLDGLARLKSPEVHLPTPDLNVANIGYNPPGTQKDAGYNPIRVHLNRENRI